MDQLWQRLWLPRVELFYIDDVVETSLKGSYCWSSRRFDFYKSLLYMVASLHVVTDSAWYVNPVYVNYIYLQLKRSNMKKYPKKLVPYYKYFNNSLFVTIKYAPSLSPLPQKSIAQIWVTHFFQSLKRTLVELKKRRHFPSSKATCMVRL